MVFEPSDSAATLAAARADLARMDASDGRVATLRDELDLALVETAPAAVIGDFDLLIERARRRLVIDPHVPVDADNPAAVLVKRLGRKSAFWYVRFVTEQVSEIADVVVNALDRVGRRLLDVEALTAGEALVDDLTARSLTPLPSDVVDLVRAAVADRGQVRVVSTGAPSIIGLGLETPQRRGRIDASSGVAGAVVLAGAFDLQSPAAQLALAADAVRVLAPGGRLVVVSRLVPPAADTVAADLADGRPLATPTWTAALTALGLDQVLVTEPSASVRVVQGDRP